MPDTEQILRQAHTELTFDFVRSVGPGGQNVNKVATAVQLRFDAANSKALSQAARARLKTLAGRRMTTAGLLTLEARRHRSQEQNKADAVERFDALIQQALLQPKRRVPTKASTASREKRLETKKRKSRIKRTRRDQALEL